MKNMLSAKKMVWLLTLMTVGFGTLNAQDKPSGTWYFKSPDGQLNSRVTISNQELLYERYQTYNVETPYWKEDKKVRVTFEEANSESYAFSGGENGEFYSGEIFAETSKGTIYIFGINEASSSKAEALKKLKEKPLKRELSRAAYSKDRLEEIENYPTLDELKKEELIEVMNHLFGYEEKMSALEGNDRMINQVGRNVMNRMFIAMNFDPEKPTNGYFMKRFADDPDIKLLLDKQVYFKMY